MEKVIIILVDGMRPDAMEACGHPLLEELRKTTAHCEHTRTVMPSVTLPCHMSLFHSVPPERHGTTTNIYMPQVRPVTGSRCRLLHGYVLQLGRAAGHRPPG